MNCETARYELARLFAGNPELLQVSMQGDNSILVYQGDALIATIEPFGFGYPEAQYLVEKCPGANK